jgi:hypothetical protein
MHRVLLSTIHFDVPASMREVQRSFWSTALATTTRPGRGYPEYDVFEHPAAGLPVVVQEVGGTAPRIHVDIETDDVEAEVRRLLAVGAAEVARRDDWVVLRDPAGMEFCVVPVHTEAFAAQSVEVGDSPTEL